MFEKTDFYKTSDKQCLFMTIHDAVLYAQRLLAIVEGVRKDFFFPFFFFLFFFKLILLYVNVYLSPYSDVFGGCCFFLSLSFYIYFCHVCVIRFYYCFLLSSENLMPVVFFFFHKLFCPVL